MRWLLALWLAIAPACAQEAVIGSGVYGGTKAQATVYATGPGDVVSGAALDISVRAYTAAIAAAGTQKLLNLRNTSTNETCDVIVTTNGGFGNVANCSGASSGDTVAVFCAESGGSCASPEGYDQSGNANNGTQGTAANQPTLTQAGSVLGGPTLTFTVAANSQFATSLNIGHNTNPFSIICWIKWTSGTSDCVGASFNASVQFGINGPNGKLFLNAQGNVNVCNSTGAVTTATWTQIGVTYSNTGTCTFYINGSSSGGAAGGGGYSTASVIIGSDSNSTGFGGSIAEIIIYTSALNSTQMSNLYSQPSVP